MIEAKEIRKPQSEYYRVGDNLHGPFSHPLSSLEAARKLREVCIFGAIDRFEGSSHSPDEARLLAEDWYWVCDDNDEIVE